MQDLHRQDPLVGTEVGHIRLLTPGVAGQNEADRHGVQTAPMPEGGPGGDLRGRALPGVPRHLDLLPGRIAAAGPLRQAALTRPLLGLASALPRRLRPRRRVQRRVEPQPADPRHLMLLAGLGQLHGREAAVEHQDQLPLGQPAADLRDHLPRPVDRGLVRRLSAGTLRPAQSRQEGQGPDPLAPGDRHQDHQGDPLQPEALHDMLPRRADGIAVAALGPDAAALAPLDGVIGGQDDRPVAGDYGDDQAERDLPGGQAGPGIAVQDAVGVGEVPLLAEPQDAQDRTDGVVAGSQEGSDGQAGRFPFDLA